MRSGPAETSIDILRQRDALARELGEAHRLLARLRTEIQHGLEHPEIAFLTLCRAATIVGETANTSPESGVRSRPVARCESPSEPKAGDSRATG